MTQNLTSYKNPIDALYGALERGEVEAAREALRPDARIWHCFDRIAMTVDELVVQWAGLVANSRRRYVTDVHRQGTDEGYVQQHLFVMEQANGKRLAWPVCVIVKVLDGQIARLDEYIDRASHMAMPDDMPTACDGD